MTAQPVQSEKEFESVVREIIAEGISSQFPQIYALSNKKAVDILICRDGPRPKIFFIEVKFHKAAHGRLGFGGSSGSGFQPELLHRRPHYFEENMRWVLGDEEHPDQFWFLDNETIRSYVAGGKIGSKFNNIQKRMFQEEQWKTREELLATLLKWLNE
ncbi:hypothetical protein [Ruegeria atlantica]|nr:hypothetical protein [Ruegeria atlantica]